MISNVGLRQHFNRSLPLLSFLLLLGLGGCSGSGRREQVVARVDRLDITMADFQTFYRPLTREQNTLDEQIQILNEKLDDLIGYKLVQEGGRADGLHRTDDFKRRTERHIKNLLNRLVKQREIVEQIVVTNAEIDSLLSNSHIERHFQHIFTTSKPGADEVERRLNEGEEWGSVAVMYSRDDQAGMHRGDLGWMSWGKGPFSVYPELQPLAYQIPVGTWQGPVQVGREYHFIKVLEERPRPRGTPEQEREASRSILFGIKQNEMEQELSNRMWREGGYHLDEDQFRWLHEQIVELFSRDPANNPLPELSREDRTRVVFRSEKRPYTAQDLLDKLELQQPRERDNPITREDWRHQFVEWVIIDEVAVYARKKGYHKDPAILAARTRFIDSRLYALKYNNLRSAAVPPTDEEIQEYYERNPWLFDLPERRQITEVLVETRQQAEELLRWAKEGEDLGTLAYEHTIRPDFAERSGRFVPIRRDEFGPLGEAVFETPEGEFGPVVETPLGFSIFQVNSILEPRVIELDSVRENLRENFRLNMEKESVAQFKEDARRRARIRNNEELIQQWAARIVVARAAAQGDSLLQGGEPSEPPTGR